MFSKKIKKRKGRDAATACKNGMAKHNSVQLYGKITGEPKVSEKTYGNSETKMVGKFALLVVKNFGKENENERTECRIDIPIVETTDPTFIKQIRQMKENDIVQVSGVIRTKPVRKGCKCSSCGHLTVKNGVKTFIHPTHIRIVKTGLTEAEAMEDVRENALISNVVYAIGYLCKNPVYYSDNSRRQRKITQFEIAIDRKLRLQDDNADTKSDYVYVKSYGKAAEEDFKYLRKASCVALNGYLQVRSYKKSRKCEFCEEEITASDYSIEIVPTSSEYCNNFRTKEEADAFWKGNNAPADKIDEYEQYGIFQADSHDKLIKQGVDND